MSLDEINQQVQGLDLLLGHAVQADGVVEGVF